MWTALKITRDGVAKGHVILGRSVWNTEYRSCMNNCDPIWLVKPVDATRIRLMLKKPTNEPTYYLCRCFAEEINK